MSNAADSEDSDHGKKHSALLSYNLKKTWIFFYTGVSKRADKRSLKLLRGSERDLKLDINRARAGVCYGEVHDERIESMPAMTPQPIQVKQFFFPLNRCKFSFVI